MSEEARAWLFVITLFAIIVAMVSACAVFTNIECEKTNRLAITARASNPNPLTLAKCEAGF